MQQPFRRPMTDAQQRQAARHFADYWQDRNDSYYPDKSNAD